MDETLVRVLALGVALASVETLHGIARTVLLAPRVGKKKALKISIFSGSALAFLVCWWMVPGLGLQGAAALLGLGLALALFMAAFDLALGRWLLKRPWRKALEDFDPRTGNYLVYGLLLLILLPWLVMALR